MKYIATSMFALVLLGPTFAQLNRSTLQLSNEVLRCGKYAYDIKKASDTILLDGKGTSLTWRGINQYTFNKDGWVTEDQSLTSNPIRHVVVFNEKNQTIETCSYDKNKTLTGKNLAWYNPQGKIISIKHCTYYNGSEDVKYTVKIYEDTTLVKEKYLRKDSASAITNTEYEYVKEGDLLHIYQNDNMVRVKLEVWKISTNQLISRTRYYNGTIYDRISYTYTDDNRVKEMVTEDMGSSPGQKSVYKDVTEYQADGKIMTFYSSDGMNKPIMLRKEYYNSSGLMLKQVEYDPYGKVTLTTYHHYRFDQYGNWIYDIQIANGKPDLVTWRKLSYF